MERETAEQMKGDEETFAGGLPVWESAVIVRHVELVEERCGDSQPE
jgi:hypothetical protein